MTQFSISTPYEQRLPVNLESPKNTEELMDLVDLLRLIMKI